MQTAGPDPRLTSALDPEGRRQLQAPSGPTWTGTGELPPHIPIGPLGWGRVALRGMLLAWVIFGGLSVLLVLRLLERPLFGLQRPITPWITVGVCRVALKIIGLRTHWLGRPRGQRAAFVSNHVSWLDIFVLNAVVPLYFIAKEEVAHWPGIGWLARATGTMFVKRDRRAAGMQALVLEARLRAGHRFAFFPEGTSTDGLRVLPFRTTLFAAFFSPELREELEVQPVSLVYQAPPAADPRLYGWWGDMDFATHLWGILSLPRQGSVNVIFHAPLKVSAFLSRKELAQEAERVVRAGLFERRERTLNNALRADR